MPALVVAWRVQERRRRGTGAALSSPALCRTSSPRCPDAPHVPLAILLLALVGADRRRRAPHAHISVPRKEATVVLAIDVSRSMTAQDVRPTRLAAARNAADAFLAKVPKEYSIAVVGFGTRAFVAVPPTTDRVLAHDALESLAPSEGTAIGDAVVLASEIGTRQRTSDGAVPPTSVLVISDGARDGGQIVAARRCARGARRAHSGVNRAGGHAASGIVTNKLVGGYHRADSAYRRAPGRCSRSRRQAAGSSSRRARALR